MSNDSPPSATVPEVNDDSSPTDKYRRYYNSKKDDPNFRAKNAARAKSYRERKAEEKKKDTEKTGEEGPKERTKKRRRIASLTLSDPDIVEMSKSDHHNPHTPPLKPYVKPQVYDTLHDICMFVANWSKDCGPITCWPHTLQILHDEALKDDEEEEWKDDMKDKVRLGLTALHELKALFLVLPKDPWMVRDIWCQAFELSGEIHRGIACIQVHPAFCED